MREIQLAQMDHDEWERAQNGLEGTLMPSIDFSLPVGGGCPNRTVWVQDGPVQYK